MPLIQLLLSLHHLSTTHFITPHRVCASRVKQLVLSVVRPSVRPSVVVVCHKKLGDSESITTSKWEDNDEIRRILAYVYLVEHKAVSFSATSAFSDYQCHPPFTAMATPTACWAGISGMIRIRDSNARLIRRTRLRVKVQPCNRSKATACD